MNTPTGLDRRAAAWLADGPTELSDRVLDAALREVHLTKQRRATRVPWRFLTMPALSRATGIAAVALVAVVGAGGLIYLNSMSPGGSGGEATPPPPTLAPTVTSAPSAPTAGWLAVTSATYGFDMKYPEGWTSIPATRTWQASDRFPADDPAYADIFLTPEQGDAQLALFVWEVPVGNEADIESIPSLISWAGLFCSEVGMPSCEEYTQGVEVLCQAPCSPAILVSTRDHQTAFFPTPTSQVGLEDPAVRVVVVARPDSFPGAARYGGSVALLRAVLTSMDVWAVGQTPTP